MLFVTATTMTAGAQMIGVQFPALIKSGQEVKGWLNIALALFVIVCVGLLLLMAASRWIAVLSGAIPVRPDLAPIEGKLEELGHYEPGTAPALQQVQPDGQQSAATPAASEPVTPPPGESP
jgi:hypothetical protein